MTEAAPFTMEDLTPKDTSTIFTKEDIQKFLAGDRSQLTSAERSFFGEGSVVEISPGLRMFMSKDMSRAWEVFAELKQKNEEVKDDRAAAFKRERLIMGDIVLPRGHTVCYERDNRIGRIVSTAYSSFPFIGVHCAPYYGVHLQVNGGYRFAPGGYPLPGDCTQLYARDFKNYGLTIVEETHGK